MQGLEEVGEEMETLEGRVTSNLRMKAKLKLCQEKREEKERPQEPISRRSQGWMRKGTGQRIRVRVSGMMALLLMQ